MRYHVTPSTLQGTIEIPPSKSHTHRALLFALLCKGTSKIHKYLDSPDSAAMLKAIQSLGATVNQTADNLEITGVGPHLSPCDDVINAQNSGIVLRFIGALAALIPAYTVITGDHSIRTRRPVKPLLDALEQLGVFAKSMRGDGYAPIIIAGPLKGGTCSLDGQDSQPISALLVASSFASQKTEIHVTHPGEKPWIDLTLSWLDFFGLPYTNQSYTHYTIPGRGTISPFEYTVPGDFSSLAFPVAAALITESEVTLENVDRSDVQGDKKLLETLTSMGANIVSEGRTLYVKKGGPLKGGAFDINDYIDAITILAVIGCFAEGETVITNAAIARKKECDRIHAIATELKKMGADIEEKEDGLIIRPAKLKGAELNTYHDHRMVMSLTVAALGAEGPSVIHGVECVAKTYPNFKEHLITLGATLQ
ncbi:MAG: 3-phosphoshikimate 1-carboxyvinyltransferase [Chlamydiia bacterium]|nr:3-phosphoshikimate 1-carboxyvinyltransferase [Chlamydiia bacterium]